MKKVVVLLSAYNGEKYIREQIESILNQTYENISLYVRDDGSSDGTVDILKEYEQSGKLKYVAGKNVGFIKSFLWLVAHCESGDYYAYADQDDMWYPEKIQMAVEMLEKEDEQLPLLYFSSYDFCDENLKFVSHENPDKKIKIPTFRNALVDCMPLGFNCVFNNITRDEMKKHMPRYSCGHDWWTYMVCQGIGKVVYDPRSTVKYRRTGNNVSGGGMSFVKLQIWRFKKFFLNDYFANIRKMLREYRYYYYDRLKDEDKKLLNLFSRKDYNLIAAMQKVFYPKMFRQTVVDEIFIRLIFLIGKL